MKQVKRAFALLLCVATVLSLCMVYAGAGDVCEKITGTGKPSESVTFTVSTNEKWFNNDIVIEQTKGTAINSSGSEYEAYGCYTVTYTNSDGKQKTKSFTGDKVQLVLWANQTYTVTVTAYPAWGNLGDKSLHSHYVWKGGFDSWEKVPEWTISARKNVTLCK